MLYTYNEQLKIKSRMFVFNGLAKNYAQTIVSKGVIRIKLTAWELAGTGSLAALGISAGGSRSAHACKTHQIIKDRCAFA
jgi:hypothetical protein